MSQPGGDGSSAGGAVLLVEHDAAVAELARRYLERAGLTVRVTATPADALAALRGGRPAVVVLDLTMPGLTPGVVRRRLGARDHRGAAELICLAGTGGLRPRHVGLAPSDKRCVARPFSPRVLVARVLAVMRQAAGPQGGPATTQRAAGAANGRVPARPGPPPGRPAQAPAVPRVPLAAARPAGHVPAGSYSLGELILDTEAKRVDAAGAKVCLTATEFALLAFLAANAGRVFTRQQLLTAVRTGAARGAAKGAVSGADAPRRAAGERAIDVHIAQLRAKLGRHSPIRTVRGVGYAAEVPAPGRVPGEQAARGPPAVAGAPGS